MHSSAEMQKFSTFSFFLSYIICFAAFLVAIKAQDCPDASCVCDTSSGRIDLNSLVILGGDYSFQGNDGKFDYYYSPCGHPVSKGDCRDAAVCQFNPENGNAFSTGSIYNEKIIVEGDSVSVHYTGGDDERQSIIKLVCDESTDSATFTALGEPYEKEYDFELRTRCGCFGRCGGDGPGTDPTSRTEPNPGGGGNGSHTAAGEIGIVLMVIALVAILVYFIVGGIILHQKYHRIGADLVPQRVFWLSLPGLVKDGFIFTFSPIYRLVKSRISGGGGDGGYETMK